MKKSIYRKIKKIVPTSLMALLMLTSCTNNTSNGFNNTNKVDKDDNYLPVERVDFNEVLKNATIGFEENFNETVLISSAVPNAKLKNQEVLVIVEMEGNTTVDDYLVSGYDSFPEFYASKRTIKKENEMAINQSKLAAELLKNGLLSEVYGNYSTLLNGFYGKTTYGKIDQIRSFANVKEAYVSTRYAKPTGVVSNNTNVDPNTGIYINDSQYDGSNTIVAVLDSGFDYTHEVFNMTIDTPAKTKDDISSVLNSTMAAQLAGFKGNSLTIDDVYISSKVPFAYDYAGKKPDVFPVESDHGTHVSGIIGGKSDVITGIAPNTQFAWMKVFDDDDGGGDSTDIICALEDAVALGVDAINLSLGAVGGYSVEVVPEGETHTLQERTNKIYQKISEVGVSLLSAAGNEYSSGYQSEYGTNTPANPESGTISSPGSYPASLTVASIFGTLDPYALANGSESDAVFFKNSYDSKQIEHKFMDELFEKINSANLARNADGSVDLEYVTIPGFGAKVNYTGLNVKGKIALVKRGSLSFEEKLKQAYAAGAFAVIVYNNVSGTLSMTVGEEVFIPIALVSFDVGTKLAQQKTGKLTFKEDFKSGPFMSDFSSWGPLADLTLKPEITAHGGNIYSSILGGEYDEMSGTSMATPNTCGIVLVIRDYVKETWPTLTPREVTQMVNRLLMSSATICLNEVGNPYSPRKQGAGLASLLNATSTQAYLYVDGIDKSKLELGDDKNKTGKYECEFNIRNISNQELTYDISNYTMTETVSSDDKAIAETAHMLSPAMSIQVGNNLTLNGSKVTVPANTDSTIKVTLNLSKEDREYLDKKFVNGMYVEGFIRLLATNENQVDLSVPFLAFYGDWLKAPMFDKTFYEVEADRVNGAISEKDKTKADVFATTPYGKYDQYYIIPLGSYIYEMDSGYDKIAATEEKAAISVDSEEAIYQLYTIYTGLLRGAKKITLTITNATTGRVVYEKITFNNRKATYYGSAGSIIPYNEDYSFDMFNLETGEIFANNTKFNVNMVAELDYENGDQVSNNTFNFSFYVDYETPTLENVKYITEWDKSIKKNRYYLELDVSDNRFVQSIRPCAINNNMIVSLTNNPIPVYQNNPNETTTVKIEITDYFAELKNSTYPDSIFFILTDYALNSNIFIVPLGGCDVENLKFKQDTIEINKNETVNLNDYVDFDGAMLQGLVWTSSNKDIAIVGDAEVIGLKKGISILTGTSKSFNTNVKVKVKVIDSNSTLTPSLSKIKFAGYNTLFSFYDDYEYSMLGSSEKGTFTYMPSGNYFDIYPSESFRLAVDFEPWYYNSSQVEIKWTSSNTAYVTVSDDGVVTAIKETISPISIKATAYIDGKETVFSTAASVSVKDPFIHSGMMLQYYKGYGGVVEIPDNIGCQYIGEYAFSHYKYNGLDNDGYAIKDLLGDNTSSPITKIIIPEGVKVIQKYAFYNLTHLEEVVLPSTLRDIYVGAFEGCTSLKKINLNNVVKIENNAFNNCSSLTTINADDATSGNDLSNVVTLGKYAFNNTKIEKLDLIRLRMAGENSFANCANLSDVTLYNENPLNINMFNNSAIKSLTIPHLLVPRNVFADCKEIENVTFTSDVVIIKDEAFKNCTSLKNITFAENCSSLYIGYNAFENSVIETLTLPSCDVTIADEAFKNSSLNELILNENSKLSFEGTPFVNTNNFEKITINGESQYYDIVDNMLVNKAKDTLILVPSKVEIVINESILTINSAAAAGNVATTSLTIPATLTNINDFAFANSNLQTIDLANATNCNFATYVFYGCENLTEALNIDKLSFINEYMFAYTSLSDINLSDNCKVAYGAFAYCEKLANVNIGNNATLGEYSFYHSFANDSTLTINSGVIEEYAFAESNIKTVNLVDVEVLAKGAFMLAKNLVSVNASKVLVVKAFAFSNCESLNNITLTDATILENKAFANCKVLVEVNGANLKEIGAYAFESNNSLANINLSNVEKIGEGAFINCSSIETIDLGKVVSIKNDAFKECISLTTVKNLEKSSLKTIPENCFYHDVYLQTSSNLQYINLSNIETIEDFAFCGNNSLNNVDLSNVKHIGGYAFYGSIISNANLTNCEYAGDFAFYATPLRELSIPKLVYAGECVFAETNIEIVDIPSTLKTIKYGSFSSIRRLSNFTHEGEINFTKYENDKPLWTINDGVLYTYLANGKLQLQSYPVNSSRISYNILEGTIRIDAYSFYTTSTMKLEEVYLPSTLESIGDSAFAGASSIKTYYFASYKAPVLEGVYNSSLQEYLASLKTTNPTIESLYHTSSSPVYNMYFYYYPYYYSNFYDYVGFVNDLTIHYPANGLGYDSLIYRCYFANKIADGTVADDATNKAIKALENIVDIENATIDNKDIILDVYNYYILVTEKEQIALLDQDKVNHLLALYEQIIDMEHPVVSNNEISQFAGKYYGVDEEETTYTFIVNANGSGSLTIDNKLNDNLDKTLTFTKIRYNEKGLQITTDDGETFIFVYDDEECTINLQYYVIDVTLNKDDSSDIPVPCHVINLPTVFAAVGGGLVICAITLIVLMTIKKKKMKLS